MISHLLVLLATISCNYVHAQSVVWCGDIDANGASGYFQMSMELGSSHYSFNIDLSKFDFDEALGVGKKDSCIEKGLKWHLHTNWNTTESSDFGKSCDATGGHYDPNLACSPSSESAATLCPLISRVSPTYTYSCSKNFYDSMLYSYCEVGDFSGKFGNALQTSDASLQFSSNGNYDDYQPPYGTNFEHSWPPNSIKWSSIVFHCSDSTNAKVVCAKLKQQSLGTLKCPAAEEVEVFNEISELDWCLIATSSFVLLLGFFYKLSGRTLSDGNNNHHGAHGQSVMEEQKTLIGR